MNTNRLKVVVGALVAICALAALSASAASAAPRWKVTGAFLGAATTKVLDGKSTTDEVARFAHTVGTVLVKRDPDHLTQEFSKADRGARILVDTGRNGYSATFAAAYTVRPKPGAPVSAPCTWEEIERGDVSPRTFTLRTMEERVAKVGDLWSDMRKRQRSLRPAIKKLEQLSDKADRK